MSEHRVFPLQPSRFVWNNFKDLVHLYAMIGIIPLTIVITYCNVFIGPATLTEIPEGYTPKYWEYHRVIIIDYFSSKFLVNRIEIQTFGFFQHPITRFLAKYITANPQQEYEKYLAHLFIEDEKRRML